MALKTTVDVNGGTRRLISQSSDVRKWIIRTYTNGNLDYTTTYTETTRERVYEWVGLTKSAAETAVENEDQTECNDGTTGETPLENASYSATETDMVIGAYSLTKTITSVEQTAETVMA